MAADILYNEAKDF